MVVMVVQSHETLQLYVWSRHTRRRGTTTRRRRRRSGTFQLWYKMKTLAQVKTEMKKSSYREKSVFDEMSRKSSAVLLMQAEGKRKDRFDYVHFLGVASSTYPHIVHHHHHHHHLISCGKRRQEPGKMSRLTLLVLLTVLSGFLNEAEANPFVYNYDRLRIGGIIFTVLLVIGAIFLLFHDKCGTKKKSDDATSQI
ncbi:hypothetical protein Q7C36_023564 [Tachysurus vachellii]|uniref:FXYD domain-containing ion transport regulator n=1 Tax=Tachysurus vachellii TaxID=175792 RepID=A0AA88IK71_TACVA|nr:hypothetical protein Q7C36_023564 [Tachysurus vachellii]